MPFIIPSSWERRNIEGPQHRPGPGRGSGVEQLRSAGGIPMKPPREWVFTAHFVDLERGFTVSRVLRKKKGKGAFRKPENHQTEDMTFQAAQSRAIRNVVLAGVPRWLTDQAKERAKDAVFKEDRPKKVWPWPRRRP